MTYLRIKRRIDRVDKGAARASNVSQMKRPRKNTKKSSRPLPCVFAALPELSSRQPDNLVAICQSLVFLGVFCKYPSMQGWFFFFFSLSLSFSVDVGAEPLFGGRFGFRFRSTVSTPS